MNTSWASIKMHNQISSSTFVRRKYARSLSIHSKPVSALCINQMKTKQTYVTELSAITKSSTIHYSNSLQSFNTIQMFFSYAGTVFLANFPWVNQCNIPIRSTKLNFHIFTVVSSTIKINDCVWQWEVQVLFSSATFTTRPPK